MIEIIPYHKEVSSQGRNGLIKTTGLELMTLNSGEIQLTPINSKGKPANCFIQIPAEHGALNALIQLLQDIKKRI